MDRFVKKNAYMNEFGNINTMNTFCKVNNLCIMNVFINGDFYYKFLYFYRWIWPSNIHARDDSSIQYEIIYLYLQPYKSKAFWSRLCVLTLIDHYSTFLSLHSCGENSLFICSLFSRIVAGFGPLSLSDWRNKWP